jgi:CRP/FNR family cyclic AMP-dependent transcriptional regulator
MALVDRFSGSGSRDAVVNALMTAKLVGGDQAMAEALADVGEPIGLAVGDKLISEGADDTDIYFILAGQVGILVKGSPVNQRAPGDHVGEIAALDPTLKRSATVTAQNDVVAWRVPEAALTIVATRFPSIWRRVAIEQSRRLIQRNALVRATNDIPEVFIISSQEALNVAREIQAALTYQNMLVTLWTDGVFRASQYAIPSLEAAVERSDFAIAVIDGDDTVQSRGQTSLAPRDNVTFELGLFMGKLGLARTLLVERRDAQVKLASDLRGITTLSYPPGPDDRLQARLGPVSHEIAKHVGRIGVRR